MPESGTMSPLRGLTSEHLHSDGDDVDLRRRDQLGHVGEGARQASRCSGPFGAGRAGVGDADELVALRQCTQRRDMGSHRPASARLQPDDADPETLSCHDVHFSI